MSRLRIKTVFALGVALASAAQAQDTHDDQAVETSLATEHVHAASSTDAAVDKSDAHAAMDHAGMDHVGMEQGAMNHASMAQMPEMRADDAGKPASDHVAPAPPQHAMGAMSDAEMVDVMSMDDRKAFGRFLLDRFEYVDGGAAAWSAQAWYGGDLDRIAFRSEGRHEDGVTIDADAELMWSHAIAPFWNSELGVRRDFGNGLERTWAAVGVQGLAPYWFELAATAYLGEQGRTALRVEADYDLLLSQRLVLTPRFEINAYGKADPARGVGAGVSDAAFGLRLRYEVRREIAPYVGVEWDRSFGETAGFMRNAGHDTGSWQWVAGVRFWF